jgi:tripartite-type tricarboxylate transporter receptor subunit TctC
LIRRRLIAIAAGAGAALLLLPLPARPQSYPRDQVRIVVPFPAGGATDVLARVLSHQLQALWGQAVIADYRPGAAGLIGTRQVVAAPADGQTLLMASTGAILVLASSQPGGGSYDIAPISLIAAPPYILVVNPALAVSNAAELIAYAKANPGKLSYGSSGVGSASHLSGALFAQLAGIELLHVPYRGTGPAVTDLLGGRIDVMFSPALTVTPHIAAGTLRALGSTGAARSALFPQFPTVAETGLPGYASLGWSDCLRRRQRRATSSARSAATSRARSPNRRQSSGWPSKAPSQRQTHRRRFAPSSMPRSQNGSSSHSARGSRCIEEQDHSNAITSAPSIA